LTDRAYSYLASHNPDLIVSDFAATEFASAIARRVRMNELTRAEGRTAFSTFDSLSSSVIERVESAPADLKAAETFIRRLDLTLRAPDALNIAIAKRIGAILMTFDDKMRTCAQTLGVQVAQA
jgi:predicted nucleic acid-binding protein